jgi:hypothetical protein
MLSTLLRLYIQSYENRSEQNELMDTEVMAEAEKKPVIGEFNLQPFSLLSPSRQLTSLTSLENFVDTQLHMEEVTMVVTKTAAVPFVVSSWTSEITTKDFNEVPIFPEEITLSNVQEAVSILLTAIKGITLFLL